MSKYEVDDFVTPPDPDLICCICRSVLYKPLESPCQHVFCKDCINTWLSEHRSCPSCRKHLSNSRLKPVLPIVRNMINRLLVRCENESRGCSKGVKLEVIEQHAKECEFALVGCLNTGCIKNVLRKDMLKHEKECPYRLVKCKKGCGLPVTVANMKEHNCIQSLKNSMQAMEQTFNQRFKDLEDKLIQSRQEVTERVSRVEQDLLDEIYDSDVRINALRSELQRHGYSLSRSLSRSRSRSRSYSRSPNRSPSHSPRRSHSNSRSRSQSPSYDSHSRDESSDRGHTDSSSNDWFRSYYEWESTSDETHEQYELPNEEPWHEGYSPDWSGRDSPYAEFSPAEEEDPPILEFTERTPWSTTRTQFFAPSGSRASQSTSDRSQSAQANRESNQVSNQLGQASSELASEGGLPPQRHSDSEESEPETSENRRYPLRIKIRRHAASSDAPELSASGPSQAGSADVAGSLYGIQVGDTDSDDEEWQPQDDTPSSDSSVTSTGDVEDDGQDLSGNENQIEASFRAARSTWTSSQRTRRAHDSGNHPTDRPSTSRQSANQEATGSERTLHRNASHSAEQTSSSRRRRRDRSDPEEDGAGRRSNKRAKRK